VICGKVYTGIEQGSAEWFEIRRGKVTASRISDVLAGGTGAVRGNYMAALISERLTGVTHPDSFKSAAMEWGTETENQARAAYAFHHDVTVERIAFVDHPRIGMTGASTDGLIGADGIVSFKCPLTATHIASLKGKPIKREYLLQNQWELACTGRKWVDHNSFDPRMPESMRLHTVRIWRDDKQIAELEAEVRKFMAEMDATIAELRGKYERGAAA
jgi:putative phage-type endonuclease